MRDRPLILVVEDSPTQAQHIAESLQNEGADIILAEDGAAGLRMVDEHKPDFVILDVNLPIMNGYQVCDRIKRDPEIAHIPVLMLTSASESKDIRMGYNNGADGYIPKGTFAINSIIAAIERFGWGAET